MERSGIVVLGMFSTGPSPTQLVFDGTILWVADNDNTITRLSVASPFPLQRVIRRRQRLGHEHGQQHDDTNKSH